LSSQAPTLQRPLYLASQGMGGSSQGPQKPVCRTSKVLDVQYYTLVFKKIVLKILILPLNLVYPVT